MITLPTYQGLFATRRLDINAQAFITATGITSNTIKAAINDLVIDLKGYGLWTKGKIINPIAGGTAATHKFNLKDPQDTNGAYRLTFAGGTVTHNSGGMTGANSYANTYLNANTVYPSGFMSMGIYLRTNTNGTICDIGALSNSNRYLQIYARFGDTFYGQCNTNNSISESIYNNDSRGWFMINRSASTSCFIQKNSTRNTFATSTAIANNNIYVMAQNNAGSANYFSNRQFAFVWVGDALTTTEATNLYTAVQTYQTTMGRNV